MLIFDESLNTFHPFSLAHLFAVLFFLLLIVLMYIFKDKVTAKFDLIFRRTVAILMVSIEWTFYAWALSRGGFQTSLLPFGVCAISMYVTAYTLWTKNEKTFRFIFPWAVAGALISLTVADQSYMFPHFRYIHYFGNHGLFLLGNLYLLSVLKFKFTYKDLLKSSLYLLIYAIIMYPINFLLDSNHLFLREIPSEVAPMYQFLGDLWVFGFAFSIFLLFNLIYVPIYIKNSLKGQYL
ncbi:MAG: TIGR02206 family membrane protein [Acholeplasmataceae bacterium]|nr:TIGR02206 family membrane protein [Acholeplasmataceae bacterium]